MGPAYDWRTYPQFETWEMNSLFTPKYFTKEEFVYKDENRQILPAWMYMRVAFLLFLDSLRDVYKQQVIINSSYRSPEFNGEIGGADHSAHMSGLAADLRVFGSHERYLLTKAAFEAGCPRIYSGEHHIHVDIDQSKDQKVMWVKW